MAKLGGKRSGTVIFDDMAFKLTPSERIIFGIIHRFSGYALGECRLKPAKIAELAGVSRSTVYNVTKHLCELGLVEVIRHQKSSGAFFRALKVVKDNLDDTAKAPAEEIEQREINQMAMPEEVESTGDDEDESTLITVEIQPRAYGKTTVNHLLSFWLQETELPINARVKANRRAAWNLAQKHGLAAVRQMIEVAALARYADYAPHIADFVDLQTKWRQLELWAEKRANAALMKKYEALPIEERVKFREQNPQLASIIDNKRKAIKNVAN